MRPRPRPEAASSGLALAAVGLLLWPVCGCGRARERPAPTGPAVPADVAVRLGPLVSEHPLYPEVLELTRLIATGESPDLRAAKQFLASPLGRELAPPPNPPAGLTTGLDRSEAEADAQLEQKLEEAREVLATWPEPVTIQAEEQLTVDTEEAVREAQGKADLEVARAERRALEERKGLLAQLEQLAESADAQKAAQAKEREAEVWREVAARAAEVRRRADQELRELERATAERVSVGTQHAQATGRRREAQVEQLREAGAGVRREQRQAVASATERVEPAANARETPPAPQTADLTALLQAVERAQRVAQERRRARLTEVRSDLIRRVAEGTRSAVQAVAMENGVTAHLGVQEGRAYPDATDTFRLLLRRYWAVEPAEWGAGLGGR